MAFRKKIKKKTPSRKSRGKFFGKEVRFSEAERRQHSIDPRLQERAAMNHPRSEQGSGKQIKKSKTRAVHKLVSGDEGIARARLGNGRDLPVTPNVKHPLDKRRGGNAALKPEDMGSKFPPGFEKAKKGARKKRKGTGVITSSEEARRIKMARRIAPDPRIAAISKGMSLFHTPEEEFTQSLENYGEGIPLAEVARRWNMAYARAQRMHKKGDWDEKRVTYLALLSNKKKTSAINEIAKEHAKLEASTVKLVRLWMDRANKRMERDAELPLDVKDDKAFIDAIDKANRILRRNMGMSETSHEVKAQAIFVQQIMVKIHKIVGDVVTDPDQLLLIADRFERMSLDENPTSLQHLKVLEVQTQGE